MILALNMRKWTIISKLPQGAGSIYFKKSRINKCWRLLSVTSRECYIIENKSLYKGIFWSNAVILQPLGNCEVSDIDLKMDIYIYIYIIWNENSESISCFKKCLSLMKMLVSVWSWRIFISSFLESRGL